MFSIEFFAWTPAPEWRGRKVRIPLEDDAIVTERGVEWIYPVVARFGRRDRRGHCQKRDGRRQYQYEPHVEPP